MDRRRVVLLCIFSLLALTLGAAFAAADTIDWDPILSIQGTTGGPALNVVNAGSAYDLSDVLAGTQTFAVDPSAPASFSYLVTNDTGVDLTSLTLTFTGTAKYQCSLVLRKARQLQL